jgi:hypothetical protein
MPSGWRLGCAHQVDQPFTQAILLHRKQSFALEQARENEKIHLQSTILDACPGSYADLALLFGACQ